MILDRVPISQLPSRYGIARSNLYTRLKDLGIEPEKEGKRAYVNASQRNRSHPPSKERRMCLFSLRLLPIIGDSRFHGSTGQR